MGRGAAGAGAAEIVVSGRPLPRTPPVMGRGPIDGGVFKDYGSGFCAAKAAADLPAGDAALWRVHGALYDLAPFADQHPGGATFLRLTRGTDCTEAFEAHHIGPRAAEVLPRYYVRDVPPGARPPRFSYAPDGLYRTLKARVARALRLGNGGNTDATRGMRAACALVVAQFLAAFALTCWTGSAWAAGLAGLCLNGMWGVGHNFFHQRDGPWRYATDLTPFSHADQRVTHALGHHMYPNLQEDPELMALEQLVVVLTSTERETALPWRLLFLPWWLPVIGWASSALSVFHPKSVSGVERLLRVAELALLCGCHGWQQGLLLYAVMTGVFAAHNLPPGLAPHHGLDAAGAPLQWRAGEPRPRRDFGEHQVATVADSATRGLSDLGGWVGPYLSLTLFGFLNDHQMHHLFPSLDHSRFPELRGVVRSTLREFGADRELEPLPVMLRALHRMVSGRTFKALRAASVRRAE